MKLIEEEKPDKYVAFIATGDGRTELHVLRSLSKVYDGTKKIYFPKIPGKRKTGLSILDILKDSEIKARSYLFILDLEHVSVNEKEVIETIKKRLNEMNLRGIEIDTLVDAENARLYLIRCKRGSKALPIYVAISGKKKKIEENIAHLIELEYGDEIEPEKGEIKGYLKRKRIKDIETFIKKSHRNSGKRNIKRAFPHIAKILEELEKS